MLQEKSDCKGHRLTKAFVLGYELASKDIKDELYLDAEEVAKNYLPVMSKTIELAVNQ